MPQEDGPHAELIAQFEAEGEDSVRQKLATRAYRAGKEQIANLWLASKEKAAEGAAQAREDARREREVGILDKANKAAWVSAIAAVLALAVSLVALYFSLTKGTPPP